MAVQKDIKTKKRQARKPAAQSNEGLMDWNNFFAAIVGGFIAAVSTMWAAAWGAKRAFTYSRTLQDEVEQETVRRLLLAIKAEVETIWGGYQLEVGHRIEALKPGQGLDLVYKLRQQYFTVYDSNAQFLGHVENDELRTAIVRTYTLAKGLVDTHLLNNDLLAKHKAVSEFDLRQFANPILRQNQERVKQDWQAFGAEIKTAYQQTKESVSLLFHLLSQSGLLEREPPKRKALIKEST